ncbi:hypothetical protein F4813DRAFT_392355 [Daldinia decipiens]|uniref:uncharacterized protein n=1 Tax=Daldinia decipiens TaxID=326647 RepID=UPI0020C52C31|nr:uncharacterized protein F4813DRAFT_392355 [Daldinia decipiens]KAI1654844.1 hypothetical protein F4813DRAFT_392355 [Daldinia decipiens]
MFAITSNQLASWILCLFILAVRAQSGCKHDDCYNALFQCDSPLALAEALNYCSTVGHYGATNYPPQATAACGNTNKRAYISACQCGVACPSFQPATAFSSTIVPTLTTLATSTVASGSNGQSSSSFPTSATPAASTDSVHVGSASPSSVLNSMVSSVPDLGSSVSRGLSSSISTASGDTGGDPSSQDPALSTQVTVSDPGSVLTISLSDSTSTATASLSTASVSDDPLSVSLNVSSTLPSTLSSTRPGFPGGQSSKTLSTLTSNSSRPATTSLSLASSSSSAPWTNTTRTSGVGLPPSADASTVSSTLLDLTSISTSSFMSTSSSGYPIGANSTVSLKSVTDASISLHGLTSTDTTCTPTPTPTSSTPCPSSSFYFHNSTMHTFAPSVTEDFISTSVFGSSTRSSLNRTSSTSLTSTTSATPSCTSTSSSKMIENGDFEQGLSPWSIDMVDVMSTSYSIARPGANGSCGAFHVHMRRNSQTDDLRANLRLVSPLISPPASPGMAWVVSFWVRFGSGRATNSYVNLFANGEVAHRVDAADKGATNWTRVEFPYTTASSDHMLQLVFSFALGNAPSNDVWIDKVAMDVMAASSVPVGQGIAAMTSKANAS